MKVAKSVEEYLESIPVEWKPGVIKLRDIFLSTNLKEELKWGIPNYILDTKLVAGIGAFKSYYGIWFHNGVFLEDKYKVLVNAQDGKTKGMRQWRMDSLDIDETLILSYIQEAIQNQKEGKEIVPQKRNSVILTIPDELAESLHSNPVLNESFHKLTPFKQREYCEFIGEAKRALTRINRLNKSIPLILQNKGLNDQYRY